MDKKRELAMLMSDISEDCWFAGWMAGNEYEIWSAIQTDGPREYGLLSIYDEDAERLRQLADDIGEWPIWDDSVPREDSIYGLHLRWMPISEWKRHFALKWAA